MANKLKILQVFKETMKHCYKTVRHLFSTNTVPTSDTESLSDLGHAHSSISALIMARPDVAKT